MLEIWAIETKYDRSTIQTGNQTSSRKHKHLCIKVSPGFHLTYSKNGGKPGVGIKMINSGDFQYFSIKIMCCGCVLESPRRGDSNTHPQHMILWRFYDNWNKNTGLE